MQRPSSDKSIEVKRKGCNWLRLWRLRSRRGMLGRLTWLFGHAAIRLLRYPLGMGHRGRLRLVRRSRWRSLILILRWGCVALMDGFWRRFLGQGLLFLLWRMMGWLERIWGRKGIGLIVSVFIVIGSQIKFFLILYLKVKLILNCREQLQIITWK